MQEIEFDILNASYWEYFKASKELSKLFGPDHPKRVELLNILNELQTKLEECKKTISFLVTTTKF